jgi:hypothetical protein
LKIHFVEVSRLEGGVRGETRLLSAGGERRAGRRVAVIALGVLFATLVAVVALMHALHRVVFAPQLVAVAGLVWAYFTTKVVRAAQARARQVVLGPEMNADGFAPTRVALVRRAAHADDVYELGIVHGMAGEIQDGRASQPLEALAPGPGVPAVYRPLEAGQKVLVKIGAESYLVQSAEKDAELVSSADRWSWTRAAAFVPRRLAFAGLVFGVIAGLWASVKEAEAVLALKPPVAPTRKAAGWEAEMELRLEAQLQAPSLHQCFDNLPLSCQKPGYVGVGLSLTKEGEIRSHWIASSTYNETCPVTACMGDLVALWQFNPLPEPMRVVLPVQVLRTGKVLPPASARLTAAADDRHVRLVASREASP